MRSAGSSLPVMRRGALALAIIIASALPVSADLIRAGYPSANVQFLPAFVGLDKGIYKSEGLDVELISVRSATVAVQALLGGQMQYILTIGPQMPAIWEG